MRAYTFELTTDKERNELFQEFYLLVQQCEAFKMRDIILMKWEKLGLFFFGLMISDEVPGSFNIVTMNAMGKSMKTAFITTKAELPNKDIVIPDNVKISIEWAPDSVNKYKIMKVNFNFIKAMLNEGATPEAIKGIYGIDLTEKDIETIKTKDSI